MTIKPKRRLLRFSLRAMLVVLTVFGVWMGVQVNRANKQKAVVRWVTENGGAVGYHWQWSEYGNKTEPDWLRRQIGDDYFRSVVEVRFYEPNVHNVSPLAELAELKLLLLRDTQVKDLLPLARLTKMERIDLRGTQVSDIAPLAKLTKLMSLQLSGTQVSDLSPLSNMNLYSLVLADTRVNDLSPLARMTKLEELDLRGTTVSDLSPLSNLARLKYLSINGNQVDDLTPLVGLSRLEILDINGTQVTDEQISDLQEALPNCEISR